MVEFKSRGAIAVVGSEQRFCRATRLLQGLEFYVEEFQTIAALKSAGKTPYAVVIVTDTVDATLVANFKFLEQIEQVVLITDTTSECDVVTALYGGAHFVFNIAESDALLRVRLHAALRCYNSKTLISIIAPPYKFDVERRQVFLNNKSIALSPKEYQFAEYLFSRPGKTVSKCELMLTVWSLPRKSDSRRVDTAACRVRKKLQLSSQITGWELINRRGAGFQLSHY